MFLNNSLDRVPEIRSFEDLWADFLQSYIRVCINADFLDRLSTLLIPVNNKI